MSMSKDKKARREMARKKAKRKKIMLIIAGIIVAAGVVTGSIFLISATESTPNAPGTHADHRPGGGCCGQLIR